MTLLSCCLDNLLCLHALAMLWWNALPLSVACQPALIQGLGYHLEETGKVYCPSPSQFMRVFVPGPARQKSIPSLPSIMSSPSPLRMQSFPPSPSIVSAPELPRIKSLAEVPVNVPEPLTIFVRDNESQLRGLISSAVTDIDCCPTFEAGTLRPAAKADVMLSRISAINP